MGDLFDIIEDLEQKLILNGEKEGIKDAEKKCYEEGFILGWQQACHIQRELGMIEGIYFYFLVFIFSKLFKCDYS